ncbi:hypothetical protein GA0111570_111110 [Raineyella antarctica]|uniref:Sap, sulfolipid-1-addressing protein n=1 Tax=Raineyella antarctica TaxID=1577474 RepID=A0A1G6HN65_9ACTN|nr:hypothetical protein [Raineyella antarctica]SDB95709.1 hypothetical protein GA0111570_111110 [Raineyella antarctica]
MNAFASLVVWLAPLTVLAMISPVVFLNASTVAANRGPSYRWRFLAGNAVVLAVLGALAMGLLGVAAEQAALRELSSRWVDGALGALLGVLAASLLRGLLRDRARRKAHQVAGTTDVHTPASLPRSLGGWGALGMVTNLTTVSLYVAMAQRIGVAELPLAVRIVVLLVVTTLVLVPAWVPMVLAAALPGRTPMTPATLRRVSSWTRGFAFLASSFGAIYLVIHAVLA